MSTTDMAEVAVLALLVLLFDQAIKRLLDRLLGRRIARLGFFGSVRLVRSQVWLARAGVSRPGPLSLMWLTSATALLVVSAWVPTSALWVALLLGGSSSHALESVTRGFISDYICLRFWPPFNIGDVAISAGGIGVLVTIASQILDW